jgi:hypothetical protein
LFHQSEGDMRWSPILSLLVGCLTTVCAHAAPAGAMQNLTPNAAAANSAAVVQKAPERLSPEELKKREPWRKAMLAIPLPKKGCFTAAYPNRQWREIPCRPSTPHRPTFPHAGGMTQLETVGGSGPDFSATVTGHISTAEGSFDSATGITSIGDYSLQLNTQHFSTSACSGSPNNTGSLTTGCRGWEQFVYQSSGSAYIQYWLLDYGPPGTSCPMPVHAGCGGFVYSDGWCPFTITLEADNPNTTQCAMDAVNEPPVSAEPMTSLDQTKLAGTASGTGDSIAVTNGGGIPSPATGDNRLPGLGANWNEAEFNAFGGGNSGQATFNSGTNVVVRTEVLSGSNAGPGCDLRSFTGESTNLTLGNSPPVSPAPTPAPALVFSESNPAPAGAAASCLDAVSIGDTHLTTFNGLLYDFQAAGDFLLADTGRDFLVQTRQVSGAPNWPDADVNNAVAVQTGKSRVAICLPDRVIVDGKPVEVPERGLALASGGRVIRQSNVYTIWGASGDSVRAEMDGSYINVSVGLGKWPSAVRGLLANANGEVSEIETRGGQVLTANLTRDGGLLRGTFPFDDLYHPYADSWRIPAEASLLSVCGRGSEPGIASRPFYAKDLAAQLAEHARGVCTTAGVTPGPLLDACTLDVAVIGTDTAAKVYVGARAPVAVGLVAIGGGKLGQGGGGLGQMMKNWCGPLVLILLLIGSILLALFGPSATGPLNILKWLVVIAGWLLAVYCLIVQFGLL